jgi:hypothetical protein
LSSDEVSMLRASIPVMVCAQPAKMNLRSQSKSL